MSNFATTVDVTVNFIYRECFVLTDDSQALRTFIRVLNKVLSASLHCLLCDASFGELKL